MAYTVVVNSPGFLPDTAEPCDVIHTLGFARSEVIAQLTDTYRTDDCITDEQYAEACKAAVDMKAGDHVMLGGLAHCLISVEG